MTNSAMVSRLLAAPTDAVSTLREEGALDQAGLDQLLDEAGRLIGSDPAVASELLDLLPQVADAAGTPGVLPAADYLRARLMVQDGEPGLALDLIESARAEYERLGMRHPALRTALGTMHVLDDLGRHTDAVAIGRRLVDALAGEQPGPEVDVMLASVEGNLGVAFGFLGEHQAALDAYRRAEQRWRAIGERDQVAAEVANQGVELTMLGRPGAAVERLDEAAAVFDAAADRSWYAKCLGHRGEALAAAGWLADALVDFQTARTTLESLGERTEVWRVTLATASTFIGLGLADEALAMIDSVEADLRDSGLRHDLAAAARLKGTALAHSGCLTAARTALAESVDAYREVSDVPGLARALLELSSCVPDDEARLLIQEVEELLGPGRWPGIRCLAALRMADLSRDDRATAQALLQEAADLADRLALPHLRETVSLRLGILRLLLGETDRGIEHLTHALAEVEQIGSRIHDEALRAAYLAGRNTAQDALVAALLHRGAPQDLVRAAALADRAKGRTLVDVMRGTVHRFSAVVDDPEAARLSGELQAAYSALFAAQLDRQDPLRATIAELERQLSVRHALAAGRPGPRDRSDGGVSDLAGVCVLAYQIVGEEVMAFVTAGGRMRVRRSVAGLAAVLALLDDLDAHLGPHAVAAVSRHPVERARACRQVLEDLHLTLVAPVMDLLEPTLLEPTPLDPGRSVSGPPSLLVVPHGPLHRVPFHALHDGVNHLLHDWVITVSPSLEVARVAAARPARRGTALVVGVADEATPGVEREALTVGAALPGASVLIGAEATLPRVQALAGRAGLVHLACHGLFRAENVAFTSFRLADQWVRASDVTGFDLSGATLVLSACESGRAGRLPGDEAAGLARGFLAAGARSVVLSQWLADDSCTAELMVELHRHLRGGAPAAAALRAAQLHVLETHPHPFHWAPFIAVGAPPTTEDA